MKILLTGSEGYIGSILKDRLKLLNVDYADLSLGVDIKDIVGESYDILIHLAAHTSVLEGEENPIKYYENNCNKLKHLLDNNVFKSVIYSSSAAIYDLDGNISPEGTYGITKLISEYLCSSNPNSIVMRFANPVHANPDLHSKVAIYNSIENHPNVFWSLAKSKVNNTKFKIHNIQGMVRDFFPMDWIINYIISKISSGVEGRTVGDICSGKHVNVVNLLIKICDFYNIEYELVDPPEGISFGYSDKFTNYPLISKELMDNFNPEEYCISETNNYIESLRKIKE